MTDSELNEIKSAAVMNFVNNLVGAFECGFIDDHQSDLADLHQCARVHCKDNYGVNTDSLEKTWGEDIAKLCKCGDGNEK